MNFYLCFSIPFILGLAIAKPMIAFLKSLNSVQTFREQGPKSHIGSKSGTPTMGAWIFLIPIFITLGILYYNNVGISVILIGGAIAIGTLMGAIDDILKILKSNYKGLGSIQKLIIQLIASTGVAYFSGRYLFADINTSFPEWMGPLFIVGEFVWAFLVIAGTSNAINLSDGLDGLATTLSILAFGGLGCLLWFRTEFAMVSIIIIIVAGLAAFLIFNFHPAKVFMGDTGSLALGMGLGTLAYITTTELYLLVFALVPVIETLSVMLQVLSAKLSRKFLGRDLRPFRMAPLHHHFELCGMHELVVVYLFAGFQLIISLVFLYYYYSSGQPTSFSVVNH